MPNPGKRSFGWAQAALVGCCLRVGLLVVVMGVFSASPATGGDAETPAELNLEQTVMRALETNIGILKSTERANAADAVVNSRRTEFLPSFSTRYGYTRYDEPVFAVDPRIGLIQPEEQYQWVTSVTQPLFTGFALTHQYQLARMGLDAARLNEALVRRDVVFAAKQVYFLLLKANKLVAVAEEAVTMLEAQADVAANFHEVGMIPLNDLLKTKVELANARQDRVAALSTLGVARTNFNLLLRRPIDAPVTLADLLDYAPLAGSLADCLKTAEMSRLELAVADLEIKIREKEVSLARTDYFPTVQLRGNYYKQGNTWQVDGGEGISDSSFWDVQAQAQWDFWQWGKTGYSIAEKRSKLAEARLNRREWMDTIQREVKEAWLKADESEKNIVTVQSAVTQAREGFRISQELFREQMATSTDVLDARTQLSETMTRYYNALYDFQIALAALDRAMGKPSMDIAEVP